MNKKIQLLDLGQKDYKETWEYQEELFAAIVDLKIKNRREELDLETPNYLLFVEHPHVYTLGKSGDFSNLLLSEKQLEAKGATFYKINRGGDITYHGPGQVVLYTLVEQDLASRLHIQLTPEQASEYLALMQSSFDAYDLVDELPDFIPPVCYERSVGYRPSSTDNPLNAWYYRTEVMGASSGKLAGKTVALKDNISLAGVPMMNGAAPSGRRQEASGAEPNTASLQCCQQVV